MNDVFLISEGLKRKKIFDDLEEDEKEEEFIFGRFFMMVKREIEIINSGLFIEDSLNFKEEVFVDFKKFFILEIKISDIVNFEVIGRDGEEEEFDGEEV